MTMEQRVLWAFGLLVLDIVIFFIPVLAFAAAYVLVVRPLWFREFVDRLYQG